MSDPTTSQTSVSSNNTILTIQSFPVYLHLQGVAWYTDLPPGQDATVDPKPDDDAAATEPRVPPIRIVIGEAAKRRLSRMNRLQPGAALSPSPSAATVEAPGSVSAADGSPASATVAKTFTSGDIEVSVKQFTHSTTKQKRSSIVIRRAPKPSDAIAAQTTTDAERAHSSGSRWRCDVCGVAVFVSC